MEEVIKFLGEKREFIKLKRYNGYDCYFVKPISSVMELGLPVIVLKKDEEIRFATDKERDEILKIN